MFYFKSKPHIVISWKNAHLNYSFVLETKLSGQNKSPHLWDYFKVTAGCTEEVSWRVHFFNSGGRHQRKCIGNRHQICSGLRLWLVSFFLCATAWHKMVSFFVWPCSDLAKISKFFFLSRILLYKTMQQRWPERERLLETVGQLSCCQHAQRWNTGDWNNGTGAGGDWWNWHRFGLRPRWLQGHIQEH